MNSLKLSPSDFAFLWEECKRCYYLKVHGHPRPAIAMPKIFNQIDNAMKTRLVSMRTETIAPGMPPGTIAYAGKWVTSSPISLPGKTSTVYVRGPFDSVVRFDDGTYGVIDFKTSHIKGGNLAKYGRQLHAYAHALENAAEGQFALAPVSTLGLVVYEPSIFDTDAHGSASLSGDLAWVELPLDRDGFMEFLAQVVNVIDSPTPPEPDSACGWCQYRDGRRIETG